MGNVLEFPIHNHKTCETEVSGIKNQYLVRLRALDSDQHKHRIETTATMRARIVLAVHDTLIDHGPDKNKSHMIATAFIMALRDIAKEGADPLILRAIVEELENGKSSTGVDRKNS